MKKIVFQLICLLSAITLSAQDIDIDTFYYRQAGEQILFEGIPTKSNNELRTFLEDYDLLPTMFPAIIVPRPVLERVVNIGNRQSMLADSLTLLTARLTQQEKLSVLEIRNKDQIIAAQKDFIAFNDQNRDMLNQSIASLNAQLDTTRKLATANAMGDRWKKRWAFILGGSLGLGIGAVLGIVATK